MSAGREPPVCVDITDCAHLIRYLVDELGSASLADLPLVECLVKHLELVSGPDVWSPRARAYVGYDPQVHGSFGRLRPGPAGRVRFLGKLLPVYCRLCFLCDCHGRALDAARTLRSRLTAAAESGGSAAPPSLAYETRALEYLTENLSSAPPPEWDCVRRSPDVSAEVKIASELLWSHLVLVYAGNRRLLLFNAELFFSRQLQSTALCSSELREALFLHGKHGPFSQRKGRRQARGASIGSAWQGRDCPVLPPDPRAQRGPRSDRGGGMLRETRVSRLCWLAVLWLLDQHRCHSELGWLSRPVPCRP
uniref:Uncharacterized protein n=1 Tax=Oryzias latipes TaxID=8090 RepID=A0A286P9T3_ORYLA|nr:hypothetical protein [Oryzias latipes]